MGIHEQSTWVNPLGLANAVRLFFGCPSGGHDVAKSDARTLDYKADGHRRGSWSETTAGHARIKQSEVANASRKAIHPGLRGWAFDGVALTWVEGHRKGPAPAPEMKMTVAWPRMKGSQDVLGHASLRTSNVAPVVDLAFRGLLLRLDTRPRFVRGRITIRRVNLYGGGNGAEGWLARWGRLSGSKAEGGTGLVDVFISLVDAYTKQVNVPRNGVVAARRPRGGARTTTFDESGEKRLVRARVGTGREEKGGRARFRWADARQLRRREASESEGLAWVEKKLGERGKEGREQNDVYRETKRRSWALGVQSGVPYVHPSGHVLRVLGDSDRRRQDDEGKGRKGKARRGRKARWWSGLGGLIALRERAKRTRAWDVRPGAAGKVSQGKRGPLKRGALVACSIQPNRGTSREDQWLRPPKAISWDAVLSGGTRERRKGGGDTVGMAVPINGHILVSVFVFRTIVDSDTGEWLREEWRGATCGGGPRVWEGDDSDSVIVKSEGKAEGRVDRVFVGNGGNRCRDREGGDVECEGWAGRGCADRIREGRQTVARSRFGARLPGYDGPADAYWWLWWVSERGVAATERGE
ncbi:hypothetical protein OF83DRAFT_1079898 [Amylostereum chailletii]|nr:hypothetical protein OF83DRAFT_1079898 [Amylostereum chailletii]